MTDPKPNTLKKFAKDFVSDPAILFVALSDPLIFMTPELLGLEGEYTEIMKNCVLVQLIAATATRAIASGIHTFNPDYKHAKFFDHLPLRISGYTHLGMGLYLAAHGAAREAAIAIPLGVGNLKLTGDLDVALNGIKKILHTKNKALDPKNSGPMHSLVTAFHSPNAHFAAAQGAVLIIPMAAFAKVFEKESTHINLEHIMPLAPIIPLAIATYFIGKNVINDMRDNLENPNSQTFNNAGYPTVLIGATAGVGGLAGLFSLASKDKLGAALNDLNMALLDSLHILDHQVQDPESAFVAAISLASLTIAGAYCLLENKFGTFFQKDRPKKTIIPKPPEPNNI